MENSSYDELVNRYKAEAEQQTKHEHALWDAYVKLGRLPDPKKILPIEKKIFEEEMKKLPVHFHIDEAAEAWYRTQQRVRQELSIYVQGLEAQQTQPEQPPQPPAKPTIEDEEYIVTLPDTLLEHFEARLQDYWTYMFLPMRSGKAGHETYTVYKWKVVKEPANLLATVLANHFKVTELRLNILPVHDDGQFMRWFAAWLKTHYNADILEEVKEGKRTQEETQPLLTPLAPGRPSDKIYDSAFNALYIQKSRTNRREAFNTIVLPTLGELDPIQAEAAYEAFGAAMNRRLQKHRRNTDENTSNQ